MPVFVCGCVQVAQHLASAFTGRVYVVVSMVYTTGSPHLWVTRSRPLLQQAKNIYRSRVQNMKQY